MKREDAIMDVQTELGQISRFLHGHPRTHPISLKVPVKIFDVLKIDNTNLNYVEIGPARFVRLERGGSVMFDTVVDSARLVEQGRRRMAKFSHDIPLGGIHVDFDPL